MQAGRRKQTQLGRKGAGEKKEKMRGRDRQAEAERGLRPHRQPPLPAS